MHWYVIILQSQKWYCNENKLRISYVDYFLIRKKMEETKAIKKEASINKVSKQAEIEASWYNCYSAGAK